MVMANQRSELRSVICLLDTSRTFCFTGLVCPALGALLGSHRTAKHMAEKLLTTKEVAARLGVDSKTVLRYLKAGRLKGAKLANEYRILESAVDGMLGSASPAVAGP